VHEGDEARLLAQARQTRVVLQEDQSRVAHEEGLIQRIERGLDVAQSGIHRSARGRRHVARLRQDEQPIQDLACLFALTDAGKVRSEQGQRACRAIGQSHAAPHLGDGFVGLVIRKIENGLGAVGEPEAGGDVEGKIQPDPCFVAPARREQVGGFERVVHGRHRIELSCQAQLRKAFVGPVLVEQQARQTYVGHGHVRIGRERAPEPTLGTGPVEVEVVKLEGLLGTRFSQIRDQGEGAPDRQVRRLECVRWSGVGAEQGPPMRFGKPSPGQGIAGVDVQRLAVQRHALAQAVGAHVLRVASRGQIELVGVGIACSAEPR